MELLFRYHFGDHGPNDSNYLGQPDAYIEVTVLPFALLAPCSDRMTRAIGKVVDKPQSTLVIMAHVSAVIMTGFLPK